VQPHEHVERLLVLLDLLERVDGGDARHEALLAGRLGDARELRVERGRLAEVALRPRDVRGERQRADVVRLEQDHVLERAERLVEPALLAEHAGPLPEELADLEVVVADAEPPLHDVEEAVVLVAGAHPAEEPVERDAAPRVARERAVERDLRVVVRGGLLEEDDPGALPELRAARVVLAERAELRGRERGRDRIAERLGARAEPLPRGDVLRPVLDDGAERGERLLHVAGGEVGPAGQGDRVEVRLLAERAREAVERGRAPPGVAPREGELEVDELRRGVPAADERLRERGLVEQPDDRRRRLERRPRLAVEVRRRGPPRRDLRLPVLGCERRAEPLERGVELRVGLDPRGGARRGERAVLIDHAREAEALRAGDRRRPVAACLELIERLVDEPPVLRRRRPQEPPERRRDREVARRAGLQRLQRRERLALIAGGTGADLEPEALQRERGRIGAGLAGDLERAAPPVERVRLVAAERPGQHRRARARRLAARRLELLDR
jgi:hypothetical protein